MEMKMRVTQVGRAQDGDRYHVVLQTEFGTPEAIQLSVRVPRATGDTMSFAEIVDAAFRRANALIDGLVLVPAGFGDEPRI